MGFFKNNLLKVIEWQDDSKDTIVYKYPIDGRKIMYGSKLTVRESQIAVFVNKGKIADIFEPGMYKLETSNLPILTQLLALPYGFKSPFYADVYFINTKRFTNLKWGTSSPITTRDKEFGTIRIKAFGSYAIKVDNPKVFLQELFSTNSTFTTNDINLYLRSMLNSYLSDVISESGVSALDMSSNLLEFSDVCKENIVTRIAELGLKLTDFVIENISFPEEVEKAIDTRASIGVLGDKMNTYVKYSTASAIGDAAKNPSSGVASTGVELAAGVAMAETMKNTLSNVDEEKKEVKKTKTKFCIECGAEISSRAKYCNECGAKQTSEHVCPSCGAKVTSANKFCDECGTKLK